MMETMRIGVLAERVGVNPKTIRYYESIQLLPEPERTEAGHRVYGDADDERLRFIKAAQAIGLALDEIREVLAFRERDEAPCPYVLALIDDHARTLDDHILELERLRDELDRLRRDAWHISAEELARKGRYCHIIESAGR